MDVQHVLPGDALRIPADAYNAMADAANSHRKNRLILQPQVRERAAQNSTIVRVKNMTGAGRNQYEVVALGDPVISHADNAREFKSYWTLEANTPGVTSDGETIAILAEAIDSGKFGLATVSGVTPVQVYVNSSTDAWAAYEAAATDGLTSCASLRSDVVGRIIWKESGTGANKWALVELTGRARSCQNGWTVTDILDNTDSPYAASVWDIVRVDIDSGTVRVDLPGNPSFGDQVRACIVNEVTAGVKSLDVYPNGTDKVYGVSFLTFDATSYGKMFEFTWLGGDVGWSVGDGTY